MMLKKNGFILALLGAIVLAFLFPQLAARDGLLKAGLVSKAGVMVIFFLQGLSLKTRELAGGFKQLKLHAFVQGWIFVFSAIILVLAALVLRAFSLPELANGFLYLALVPTTISSAVAFTGAAGGNVPAAIFNTTLSNVIGVFWVPVGCLVVFATGGELPTDLLLPLLVKIIKLILLPLIAGQILRPFIHESPLFLKARPSFKLVNHSIILFIVFAAIGQSLLSDAWEGIGAGSILLLIGVTALAVLLIHTGTWISSARLAANYPDRVAALFCGSQKTLAAGAPMAVAIFSDGNALGGINPGLMILPLLCYHPLQLLLAAMLLPKLGN
jgi:sodium/bile acid cotransporter 7